MRTATSKRTSFRTCLMTALLTLALPLNAYVYDGGYRLLELNGYMVKWGTQELGVGANVSYAFADQSIQFGNARNCGELAPMTALAGDSLSDEILKREAEAAFQVWERASGLTFHQVDDARDADIVLGAQGQPRGKAFANVVYTPGPAEGVRTIQQSLVCLNPEQRWKVGFDGDLDAYDIRYTLIHEIGHAIGLDHPGPSGQLMGFRYTEEFAGLQPGDIEGVRRLYGPGATE